MKQTIARENTESLPLQMVCSTKFGRYPKISAEQTWNMFISDGFMVPYAGHTQILNINNNGLGRGLYNSQRGEFLLMIVDEQVYRIDKFLKKDYIGSINTSAGDVFIEENDAFQIGICDSLFIYIYNYSLGTFAQVNIAQDDFIPGSLSFQDGYFIAACRDQAKWRLSKLNDGTQWPANPENVGLLQAPDNVLACIPMPNIQGQLFVFGSTVTHCFNDVGSSLFPYQRNNSFAIDYGCINPATIAAGDKFIIWLGNNNKSGLAIMYSSGGQQEQISTDGINLKLEMLYAPEKSYGSLVKIDGHLFYQLTFVDPRDNLSLAYDFNTRTFLFVSDHKQNYHEAKKIVYFNGDYYFINFNDGNLYKMGSSYVTYDGYEIPRIIITPTIRKLDTTPFIVQNLSFVIEQGDEPEKNYTNPLVDKGNISLPSDFPVKVSVKKGDLYHVLTPLTDNDITKTNTGQLFGICKIVWSGSKWDVVEQMISRVDLSLSKDGGNTFGCVVSRELNKTAHRKNILTYWGLGRANELTCQFRFYGRTRFVIGNGDINTYT